ncbi:hypothetical protein HFP71_35380 [Streptomyces sp. ARC32]
MSDTQLTVTLDGGGIDDARAMEGVHGAGGRLRDPRRPAADEGATVRTATFDSTDAPRAAAPTAGGALSGPVTVTVQGTPRAVEAASATLSRAFTARDEGAASGDQERERQLLLEP